MSNDLQLDLSNNTRRMSFNLVLNDNQDISTEAGSNNVLDASFFEEDNESEDFLLEILLGLYGSKSLTLKHCEEVLKYLIAVSEKTTKLCVNRISQCQTIEEAKSALIERPVIDFTEFSSEHKLKEKLKKKDLFREPTKFTIANEVVERIPGNLENVPHLGVIMDFEFQITKFLEVDGILEMILNNQETLESIPDGVYKNFVNGKSWKNLSLKFAGKTVIPIFLYNDDFQVCKKLIFFFL